MIDRSSVTITVSRLGRSSAQEEDIRLSLDTALSPIGNETRINELPETKQRDDLMGVLIGSHQKNY